MNRTNLIEDFTLMPLPAWWESPWVWLGAVLALAVFAWLGSWWWRRWAGQSKPVSTQPPNRIARRIFWPDWLSCERGKVS